MTERELSERLCALGCQLEKVANLDNNTVLQDIAEELHVLSNEKYTPGTSTWKDLRNPASTKKKNYTDQRGVLPF